MKVLALYMKLADSMCRSEADKFAMIFIDDIWIDSSHKGSMKDICDNCWSCCEERSDMEDLPNASLFWESSPPGYGIMKVSFEEKPGKAGPARNWRAPKMPIKIRQFPGLIENYRMPVENSSKAELPFAQLIREGRLYD